MRSRSRAHGAVAVICAISAGCSLAVSLDGLSGGGATGASDGGGVDASTLPSDAAAAVDGDSAADRFVLDAPVVPFCSSHPGHSLCMSFDDPDSGVPPGASVTAGGGALAVVPNGLSPPNALRAYLPPSKSDYTARSEIPIPVPSSTIHWEASVKRGAVDPLYGTGGFLSLISVVCDTPAGSGGAFVHYTDGAVRLRRLSFDADGGLDERRATVAWPADGAWHRVAIDVALGSNGSAKVAVDGAVVAEIAGGAFTCSGATAKYVTAGMLANGGGGAERPSYEALYDDFLGDWK